MGAYSNHKGNAYEREVRLLLREWWGCDWERTTLYGGTSKRGKPGDVVAINPAIRFPWVVECKSVEDVTIDGFLRSPGASRLSRALEQARKDRDRNAPEMPVMLLLKRKRAGILALYEGPSLGPEVALLRDGGEWLRLSPFKVLVTVSPRFVVRAFSKAGGKK